MSTTLELVAARIAVLEEKMSLVIKVIDIDDKKEAKKEAAPKEKKKPNGYLSWASENRAAIKAELKAKLADDEKVTGPQLMAAVAAAWKALPEEERAEWNEKAKAVASSDEE